MSYSLINSFSSEDECQTHPPYNAAVRASSSTNSIPRMQRSLSKQEVQDESCSSASNLNLTSTLQGHPGLKGLFENRFM